VGGRRITTCSHFWRSTSLLRFKESIPLEASVWRLDSAF
jgi:hypothetical protein